MKILKKRKFKLKSLFTPVGKKLIICFTFIFLMGIYACEKEQPLNEAYSETDNSKYTGDDLRIYKFFEDLDAELENLKITEHKVFYGKENTGCSGMRWSKNTLLKEIKNNVSERQRGLKGLYNFASVNINKVNDIKVYIRSSVQNDSGVEWSSAIWQAAAEWSNNSDCRANISVTAFEEEADIKFYSELDESSPWGPEEISEDGIVAGAASPAGGKPGDAIVIAANNLYTDRQRKSAIMHELGHTLGFGHTDEYNVGFHIPGTASNNTNSIMNSKISDEEAVFTYYDKKAFKTYYPNSLTTPASLSAVVLSAYPAYLVEITCKNPNFNSKPYFWLKVEIKDNVYGGKDTHYVQYNPNSSTGLQTFRVSYTPTPNNKTITIKGTNYKRDFESSGSSIPFPSNSSSVSTTTTTTTTSNFTHNTSLTNGIKSIKSYQNLYLCSENGNIEAYANRSGVEPWEKFTFHYNSSDGTYSIKGNNGKYADIWHDGGGKVQFINSDKGCGDCRFYVEHDHGNYYYIKGKSNGKYLSSDGCNDRLCGKPVLVNRDGKGDWERWEIKGI